VARHQAGPGDPDATDTVEWEPGQAGRHPLPWRLVLGLGIPLGLVVAGVVWAVSGGSDPAPPGPSVVVEESSAQPTDWVPGAHVELGAGTPLPTPTPTASPTPTAAATVTPTPSQRTSAPKPPPPAPLVFSARYAMTSSRSGGFTATVTVTNESSRSGSWEVHLDYPSPDKVTVTSVTNATFSQAAGELVFTGGPLGGGETVTVQFDADKNRPGETSPTKCTINGVDCLGF
jgi:hypothetical protein